MTDEEKVKIEYAPISKKIGLSMLGVTTISALITVNDFRYVKFLALTIVADAFAWITIKVMNDYWVHRHHIQLGADAARIEASDLLDEYEADYRNQDKYISQRLLAGDQQEQVPDAVGALIYMTGRYRCQSIIDDLSEQCDNAVADYEEMLAKYNEVCRSAKEINRRYSEKSSENKELVDKNKELAKELAQTKSQLDRVIREYEMEVVGYAATDEERKKIILDRAQKKMNLYNPELVEEMGYTVEDFIDDNHVASGNDVPEAEKQSGDLTESQIKDILFKLKHTKMTQKEIAELYGVTQPTISKIKKKYGEDA